MANKQTLPNMGKTSKGLIQTSGVGQVNAPKYNSPFSVAAQVGQGIVGVSGAFTKLKYSEFAAQLESKNDEYFHRIQDASDPCELPEIMKSIYQENDNMFKNDPYGKGFYESDLYKIYKTKLEGKLQEAERNQYHVFNVIQAEKTASSMATAFGTSNDPAILSSYQRMLDQTTDLTPKEKNTLMKNLVEKSINSSFSVDPNATLSFVSSYDLSEYGVDVNSIRKKVDDYNKAKRREALQEEALIKKQEENRENAIAEGLANQVLTDPENRAMYQDQADSMGIGVSSKFSKLMTSRYGKQKSKSEFEIAFEKVPYEEREQFIKDNKNKYMGDSAYRAIANFIKERDTEKDSVDWSNYDIVTQGKKEGKTYTEIAKDNNFQGKTLAEMEKVYKDYDVVDNKETATSLSNELNSYTSQGKPVPVNLTNRAITFAENNKNDKDVSKIWTALSKDTARRNKEETSEQKDLSQKALNKASLELGSVRTDEELSEFVKKLDLSVMTEADKGKFINQFNARQDKILVELKKQEKDKAKLEEKEKKLQQQKNFLGYYVQNGYLSDEDIQKLVDTGQITPSQGKQLKDKSDKYTNSIKKENEKIKKENDKINTNNFLKRVAVNSLYGQLTPYENGVNLTPEQYAKYQNGQELIKTNNYNAKLKDFAFKNYGKTLSQDDINNQLNELTAIAPVSKLLNNTQELQDDYRRMIESNVYDNQNKMIKDAVNWVFSPLVGDKLTPYEIERRTDAFNAIMGLVENERSKNRTDIGWNEIVKLAENYRPKYKDVVKFSDDKATRDYQAEGLTNAVFHEALVSDYKDKKKYVAVLNDKIELDKLIQLHNLLYIHEREYDKLRGMYIANKEKLFEKFNTGGNTKYAVIAETVATSGIDKNKYWDYFINIASQVKDKYDLYGSANNFIWYGEKQETKSLREFAQKWIKEQEGVSGEVDFIVNR